MSTLILPRPTLSEGRFASIPVFTDQALFEACGVRIAFTTREGGVSSGAYDSLNFGSLVDDDPELVIRNRELLVEALMPKNDRPLDEMVVVPKQVHGDRVLTVQTREDVPFVQEQAAEGADAIVVDVADVAALLCFADCVPVIIVLPTGRFAVVHAGWRGVENEITAKTFSAMLDQELAASACDAESVDRPSFSCNHISDDQELSNGDGHLSRTELAAGANVYIGPYIHRECFETSSEIHDLFVTKFGSRCDFDSEHIDLGEALRVQLERLGVDPMRICDLDVCTVCSNDRFFSFRGQDGIAGRHGAFAARL